MAWTISAATPCELTARRLTASGGYIFTPESISSISMGWRALSRSARSNDGILAVGDDWSPFELREAYGAVVGGGVIDMALHLWRSSLSSVHGISRSAPERSLATG